MMKHLSLSHRIIFMLKKVENMKSFFYLKKKKYYDVQLLYKTKVSLKVFPPLS